MDTDQILLLYVLYLCKDLCVPFLFPYLFHIERHASCQVSHRLFMSPFFQDLTYAQQQHNGTCSAHIAPDKRYTYRGGIQHRYFQLSAADTLQTFFNKMKRLDHSLCLGSRCRKKQFT